MKRGCVCLLLAVAFLTLPVGTGAQDTQGTSPPARQSADEYAFRVTFFVVQKLERSGGSTPSDPLTQAANGLFAADKQEQIRRDLERKIGAPGSPQRAAKFDKLLEKIDRKLSDKKIAELRAEMAKGGARGGWPWPLCVIAGCK